MISVNRVIRPSLQQSFASRNGSTSKKFHSHAQSQGAAGRRPNEIEASWLGAKGALSGKNLSELWDSYLTVKGFTVGNLKSRMIQFFTAGTQA